MRNDVRFATLAAGLALAVVALVGGLAAGGPPSPPPLAPLPELKPEKPEQVELGKMLFFDNRMSGDADRRCADCHDPKKGWADGMALSDGYPGNKYFRNSKTIINVAYAPYLYWDGRLDGEDLPTQVRDALTESYWHLMDGRIMLERWKQAPEYVERFKTAMGGEANFGRTLNAVAAFMKSLTSKNVPFDKYLKGDQGAISEEAKQGLALFQGKAGCIECHNGPMLSDYKPRALGVPENPYVFLTPKRHLQYRSVMKSLGVPNYMNLLEDVGYYGVSKLKKDMGTFITPTLREVSRTAPYMHNGMLATLEDVVEFYNKGGGDHPNKDALLKPLGLSVSEKAALAAFLKTLSGDELIPPDLDRLNDQKMLAPYARYDWLKYSH